MKDKVLIHKQHLFHLGEVQRSRGVGAEARRPQRPFSAGETGIDRRQTLKHLGRHDPKGAMETLLQEGLGGRPAFVDEPLKGLARKTVPQFATDRPALLLEQCPKRGLLKPEQPDIAMIRETVFGAPHSLKVLVIEPVHVRMGIARIPRATIDIPTVHRPEIGDDIHISFCNAWRDIGVEEGRNQPRIHYPRLLKLYGQRER
jgi:hypothetical protein